MLETNIDNMNPEIYSYLFPKLLENKALDVFTTAILMKKNRPANILSVLCKESDSVQLEEIILVETTTLGIRKYKVERNELDRIFKQIETPYGAVTVKFAYKNDVLIKFAPEFEECKKIAETNKIALQLVINNIMNAVSETLN